MGTAETKLIPVPKWNNHHDWPSVSGWRKLIFNSPKNGIDKVILRVNKRILIDEAAFFEWAKDQNASYTS
jgi:hypothetical protein